MHGLHRKFQITSSIVRANKTLLQINDKSKHCIGIMASTVTSFTPEEAKGALNEVLSALMAPENVLKLAEAKENCGNEMMKMMQFVFPIVTQIQMDVLKNYGFSEGREGIIQFAKFIRTLERDDPEIAQLNSQVRAYFLPPMPRIPLSEASL